MSILTWNLICLTAKDWHFSLVNTVISENPWPWISAKLEKLLDVWGTSYLLQERDMGVRTSQSLATGKTVQQLAQANNKEKKTTNPHHLHFICWSTRDYWFPSQTARCAKRFHAWTLSYSNPYFWRTSGYNVGMVDIGCKKIIYVCPVNPFGVRRHR